MANFKLVKWCKRHFTFLEGVLRGRVCVVVCVCGGALFYGGQYNDLTDIYAILDRYIGLIWNRNGHIWRAVDRWVSPPGSVRRRRPTIATVAIGNAASAWVADSWREGEEPERGLSQVGEITWPKNVGGVQPFFLLLKPHVNPMDFCQRVQRCQKS